MVFGSWFAWEGLGNQWLAFAGLAHMRLAWAIISSGNKVLITAIYLNGFCPVQGSSQALPAPTQEPFGDINVKQNRYLET